MRLIDADEIIKETWGVVIKDMFHMDETVDVISRKDIEKAPTVKAIPIEWLDTYVCNITKEEKLVIDKMFIKWAGEENETN